MDELCAHRAALRGIGITQLPNLIVEDELKSGALIAPLPEWAPKAGVVHAVFPSRRGLLPSVRALIDYLASRLE